ncbi:TlpA disulfide reductase family protein [Thermithiobacillus plumbiphilus]|uniref:TlpA disulfide reductase family protein n=1 Tax=Thermithiobacillus plumbiphilus TaxID=1729899 RepID=A0ABU9D6L2_9PROT
MKQTRHLILLLGFLILSAPLQAAPPRGLMPVENRPAPALRLSDMDGRVTDLRSLRGQWVLVHFWASWCGPCRQEMPSLQRLDAKMPDSRLRLLLVNTAESQEEVFTFLSTVAPDLHSLLDPDGRVTENWRPRGLPSSFLVDPQGRIRYLALGGRDWDVPPYLPFLQGLTR